MSDIQFDKMTVGELRTLKQKVEKLIASKRNAERAALREKLKLMAEAAGFSWSDVAGTTRARKNARSAAAKYVNPDDSSQSWSGRGRKPNWLTAKIEAGASLDDFLV